MAFGSSVRQRIVFGNKRVVIGDYTNSSSTGGDINTGLSNVDAMILLPVGSSVNANAPVVNETFPVADGSAITIVTDSNANGAFIAIGD
jgi:hypothetical protein